MSVEQNLQAVREKIERAGRNPDDITIVAVTKGFGPEVCRAALSAGLTVLGENRVLIRIKPQRVVRPPSP